MQREKLRELIKRHCGIREFARRTGISRTQVINILLDKPGGNPSLKILEIMQKELGLGSK